jgi:hypothetical protein
VCSQAMRVAPGPVVSGTSQDGLQDCGSLRVGLEQSLASWRSWVALGYHFLCAETQRSVRVWDDPPSKVPRGFNVLCGKLEAIETGHADIKEN